MLGAHSGGRTILRTLPRPSAAPYAVAIPQDPNSGTTRSNGLANEKPTGKRDSRALLPPWLDRDLQRLLHRHRLAGRGIHDVARHLRRAQRAQRVRRSRLSWGRAGARPGSGPPARQWQRSLALAMKNQRPCRRPCCRQRRPHQPVCYLPWGAVTVALAARHGRQAQGGGIQAPSLCICALALRRLTQPLYSSSSVRLRGTCRGGSGRGQAQRGGHSGAEEDAGPWQRAGPVSGGVDCMCRTGSEGRAQPRASGEAAAGSLRPQRRTSPRRRHAEPCGAPQAACPNSLPSRHGLQPSVRTPRAQAQNPAEQGAPPPLTSTF